MTDSVGSLTFGRGEVKGIQMVVIYTSPLDATKAYTLHPLRLMLSLIYFKKTTLLYLITGLWYTYYTSQEEGSHCSTHTVLYVLVLSRVYGFGVQFGNDHDYSSFPLGFGKP